MNTFFEIVFLLMFIGSLGFNFYLFKELILITRNETRPTPEKIFPKIDKKEEVREDILISGLNNLLTYDGTPSAKKE